MDLKELILTRRTVHNYRPEPVSDTLVREALSLSLWAPNHRLSFPWVYVEAGPEARVRLADLAVELKAAKEPQNEVKAAATRAAVMNPSHLIFLARRLVGNAAIEHEDYATLGASVQIASLWLWQHGIATKWSTGGFTLHDRTYEILGLNPAEVRLEGALMVGHAAVMPKPPERPALQSVMRRVP